MSTFTVRNELKSSVHCNLPGCFDILTLRDGHHHHQALVPVNWDRYMNHKSLLVRSRAILSITLSALRSFLSVSIQVFLGQHLPLEVPLTSKQSIFLLLHYEGCCHT